MSKRGGFKIFGTKRAMSPLIATVLLIAFAVAMGAMIMNWSSSLGESLATQGPDCSGINIIKNPVICYSQNLIKISVRNEGIEVQDLTVKISDSNTENKISLKNSHMKQGDHLEKDIPFAKTSTTYISIIPSVDQNGKAVQCDLPALEIPDLPDCQ